MNAAAFADTVPAHWNAAGVARATNWTRSAADTLAGWFDATRSRQSLDELDERLLRDIGLTRDEARREASKFFWQA